MKRIKKILVIVSLLAFSIVTFSSCSVFERTTPDNAKRFKHKQPLPKKYIIPEKSANIIK